MNKKSNKSKNRFSHVPVVTAIIIAVCAIIFFSNGRNTITVFGNNSIFVTMNDILRKYPFGDASGYIESNVQYPFVTIESKTNAPRKINEAIRAENEALFADIEAMASELSSEYMAESDETYSIDRNSYVARLDSTVLSLVFTDVSFTGGVHPNSYRRALNFSTRNGKNIVLSDITDDTQRFIDTVASYINQSGSTDELNDMYYEGWQDSIKDEIKDSNWYFSNDGITIIINEYIIAPHAAGIIEFTIPYSELSGIINNKFVPTALNGNKLAKTEVFGISQYSDNSSAKLPSAKVTIDENGEQVLLTANSDVYNVRLTQVYYNETDNSFHELQQYFAANKLSAGSNILAETYIPDVMPNLRLSYKLPDGTAQERFIMQSGKDGSLMLLNMELD